MSKIINDTKVSADYIRLVSLTLAESSIETTSSADSSAIWIVRYLLRFCVACSSCDFKI